MCYEIYSNYNVNMLKNVQKNENNMQKFFSIILINKSYLNIYLSEERGFFFK